MATSWTRRGQGSCPKCQMPFRNRWKLRNCPKCDYLLGGSAPAKVPKITFAEAVMMSEGLFSVKTSSRDDRCFVCKDGDQVICLNRSCTDNSAASVSFVASNREHKSKCKHTELAVNSTQPPLSVSTLSEDKIAAYNGDASSKAALQKAMLSMQDGLQSVYEVTEKTYAVYGPKSASNSTGYCHVKKEKSINPNAEFFFKCTGKNCKGIKQEKTCSICIYLHTLFCCLELSKNLPAVHVADDSDSTQSMYSPLESQPSTSPAADKTSNSRAATLKLYADKTLPYHFNSEFMSLIKKKEAETFLGSSTEGWPLLFEVGNLNCEVCGNPLGPGKIHPGSRGSSILYTNLNPFKEIIIHVKECTKTSCKAMHRVFPTDEGKNSFLSPEAVILLSAPRIKTSIWLDILILHFQPIRFVIFDNESVNRSLLVYLGAGQRSQSLVLENRIIGSGDKNGTLLAEVFFYLTISIF